MRGNKLIFDTSALIEMHEGSKLGEEAKQLFLAENTLPFVASISIAEFASQLMRKGTDPDEQLHRIFEFADMLPLTSEIAMRAGLLHAKLRKKSKNISLADCIIMAHADREGATVVTTDCHFSLYKNTRLL